MDYLSKKGNHLFVASGHEMLGLDNWFSIFFRTRAGIVKRVSDSPIRLNREDAQWDLDQLAQRKGLKPMPAERLTRKPR